MQISRVKLAKKSKILAEKGYLKFGNFRKQSSSDRENQERKVYKILRIYSRTKSALKDNRREIIVGSIY